MTLEFLQRNADLIDKLQEYTKAVDDTVADINKLLEEYEVQLTKMLKEIR